MSELTVGSLFSGIGGIDLGLEATGGFTTRWFCEIDSSCRKVLTKHWPDRVIYGDVRAIDWSQVEAVDLVCGGDPCQGNSKAQQFGKAAETLTHEFIRCVAVLRPRFVLRENPLPKRDAPGHWRAFLRELTELGYDGFPFGLRACCLGANHKRARVFVFAALGDSLCAGRQGAALPEMATMPGRKATRDLITGSSWGQAAPRACTSDDGFPRGLVRRQLRMLGNAVPPPMAEHIGNCILTAMERAA